MEWIGMRTGLPFACSDGSHGHAASDPLRHGDDVGDHAEILERERLARAVDASLHLVAITDNIYMNALSCINSFRLFTW